MALDSHSEFQAYAIYICVRVRVRVRVCVCVCARARAQFSVHSLKSSLQPKIKPWECEEYKATLQFGAHGKLQSLSSNHHSHDYHMSNNNRNNSVDVPI